jgi:hypothetical protein
VVVRLVADAGVDRWFGARCFDRLGRLRLVRDAVGLPVRRTLLLVGVGAGLVAVRARWSGDSLWATVEADPDVHAPAGKTTATAASIEISRRRPLPAIRLR